MNFQLCDGRASRGGKIIAHVLRELEANSTAIAKLIFEHQILGAYVYADIAMVQHELLDTLCISKIIKYAVTTTG